MEQLKKEVQVKILKESLNFTATKEEFLNILRQVSPGTNIRTAIEGIVKSQKGALIVVENSLVNQILDGGFKINARFTPQKLMELSKMDGAIILSKDMKRINYSNVTLTPETKIPSNETGTRHKSAERTAKMAGTLVIAVSEKRHEITIYYKDIRYNLRETSEISRRATETLHILEKQRELFDEYLAKLNEVELSNEISLDQACKVIQKGKVMEKILKSQEKTLIELGKEGEALKLRIKELMHGVEKETDLVIKDYTNLSLKKTRSLMYNLTYEELINIKNITVALAQKESNKLEEIKGWRLLSKTSLEEKEIAQIIASLNRLPSILNAPTEEYRKILSEEKANNFAKEIEKIKNN